MATTAKAPLGSLRAISTAFIAIVILAALAGLLGVRTDETVTRRHGFALAVDYATVTRPGLATPFQITVSSSQGALPREITLRLSSSYLEMLDLNGLDPVPDSSLTRAPWTWWTFAVPPAQNSFTLRVDARLEPAVQWGRSSSIALEVAGVDQVTTHISTWVLP